MRALTIRQPWAWAIFNAGKDIENRGYRPWQDRDHTETIAIHAASRKDNLELLPRGLNRPKPEELATGAIIGVVDVVNVVDHHRSRWFTGPWGWVLRNPRALRRPVPCTGARRLWEVPPRVARAIRRQLSE